MDLQACLPAALAAIHNFIHDLYPANLSDFQEVVDPQPGWCSGDLADGLPARWDGAGCPVPASGAFLTCSSLHNQVFFALSLCLAFQPGDESGLHSSYTPRLNNRREQSFDETRTVPQVRELTQQ